MGCTKKAHSHSTIDFSVRQMMISKKYGVFESYHAEIAFQTLNKWRAFTIAVASVSTKNFDRDVHLVSLDFLTLTFIQKFHLRLHILKN
ncbi:YceI family protein [Lysinibacillus xylanilyticus]|uniref:YceI family protein n=1 Tax=Lysinibacillus xylanilyticus TaxID=582475 RepID=UPI003817CD21